MANLASVLMQHAHQSLAGKHPADWTKAERQAVAAENARILSSLIEGKK